MQHLHVVAMDHFSANAAGCHTYFWKLSGGIICFKFCKYLFQKNVVVVLNIFRTCKFLSSTNCSQIVVPNNFLVIWSFPNNFQESFLEWLNIAKLLFSCWIFLLVEEFIFYVILIDNVRVIHLGNRLVGFHQLTVQRKMFFSVLFLKCCCQVNKRISLFCNFFLFIVLRRSHFFVLKVKIDARADFFG